MDANANDLTDAVTQDDPIAIRVALAAGDAIDGQHLGGQTALMMGCLHGKPKAVAALLEAGADREQGEAQGYTCVHGVGFQGRAELAPGRFHATPPRLLGTAFKAHRDSGRATRCRGRPRAKVRAAT
ncbi:hypothetical protein T492DRAFT_847013 [Pavlovales sp. CCMP2436]|nr:hypothetical protein T492DRAFT_847013 [Pavlovales sp. CCMP2436]